MFFRREKPHVYSFQERIDALKPFGFAVQPDGSGRVKVTRDGMGALIKEVPNGKPQVDRPGLVIGDETGLLVNAGYQQYFLTPSGRKVPALVHHLHALHNFQEDLKEGLGLTSLYNDGLGTVSELHLYDRVEDRDSGKPHKPWEKQITLP